MRKLVTNRTFELCPTSSPTYFGSDQKLSVLSSFPAVTDSVVWECLSRFYIWVIEMPPTVVSFSDCCYGLVTCTVIFLLGRSEEC